MVKTRFFRRRAFRVAVPSLVLCGVLAGVALFAGSTAEAAGTCSPSVPAASCTIDGTVTITGGVVKLQAPGVLTFAATTLNGTTQYALADSSTYDVIDATGTSAGWTVTAEAPAFTCDNIATPTCGTKTLPATSFFVNGNPLAATDTTTAPTAGCIPSTTCTTATLDSFYAPIGTGPTTILHAATGTGMGSNRISNVGWWLTIPPATTPGTYTSTVTVAASSGP